MLDMFTIHGYLKASKSHLQREITRLKLSGEANPVVLSQLGRKLDFIHEAERIGVRNLDERYSRKIEKLAEELGLIADAVAN